MDSYYYNYYITPEEYEEAKKNGIDKSTLERRIREYGWEKDEAIKKPKFKRPDRSKWIKKAAENGIAKSTFLSRVNNLQWSLEKAATTPRSRSGRKKRK